MENILNFSLFTISNVTLYISDIITLILFIIVLKLISKLLKKLVFKYSKRDKGSSYAVFNLVKYLLWVIGISIYLDVIGFDVTLLIAGSAALLVGIGIGLQQTFNDFISGIILLFEGSIQVGDIVILEDDYKRIVKIGLRTSKAISFDNSMIIVPNSKIVTERVINYNDGINYPVRFQVEFNIAFNSDLNKVKSILLSIAKTHDLVLTKPEPFVMFDEIANSSYKFRICFFVSNPWDGFGVMSDLRYEIVHEFNKNNIEIPYPKSDINLNKVRKDS
jgi:small-conductance mechanosensitive channel